MFGRSKAESDVAAAIDRRTERIEALLERLDAALIVRDPGTARSADAYDGLRKTVAAAAADRRRLCVLLVDLHDRLYRGTSLEDLTSVVDEWVAAQGLVRDQVAAYPDAFEVVEGIGHGDVLEVLQPAWIDSVAEVVVRRGQARFVRVEEPSPERRIVDATSEGDAGIVGATDVNALDQSAPPQAAAHEQASGTDDLDYPSTVPDAPEEAEPLVEGSTEEDTK